MMSFTVYIELSDKVSLLGELTFAPHSDSQDAASASSVSCALEQLMHQGTRPCIRNGRLDYCNSVFSGVAGVHLRQLQSLLNVAARLVAQKRKYDHINATSRDDPHCLPIF
jgi:hypothetical protein